MTLGSYAIPARRERRDSLAGLGGFRNRALDVQGAILNGLEQELESVTLVMGDHGVFKIRADGDVVYDKEENEFDVDDIVRELREA